uniref:Putative secreted peptide n=1 Tax=Anopheles braziliensis TaxID=58242 RepID=A0A2M3ZMK7_9DIPT
MVVVVVVLLLLLLVTALADRRWWLVAAGSDRFLGLLLLPARLFLFSFGFLLLLAGTVRWLHHTGRTLDGRSTGTPPSSQWCALVMRHDHRTRTRLLTTTTTHIRVRLLEKLIRQLLADLFLQLLPIVHPVDVLVAPVGGRRWRWDENLGPGPLELLVRLQHPVGAEVVGQEEETAETDEAERRQHQQDEALFARTERAPAEQRIGGRRAAATDALVRW